MLAASDGQWEVLPVQMITKATQETSTLAWGATILQAGAQEPSSGSTTLRSI